MNIIKKYIPFIFAVILTTILIIFRSVPTGHIWDGYTVLYVPASIDEQMILDTFKATGIEEYASLGNQKMPVILGPDTVEAAMLKLNINSSSNSYLSQRENYFYDSTGKYKLFYIPDLYKKNLDVCLHYFEKSKMDVGLDSSFSYPWLLPILIVLFSVMMVIFSKKKLVLGIMTVVPIVYVFCNPFYSAAAAVILLLISLFFITNLWGRKGSLKRILNTFFILIALGISLFAAFSSTILSGIFYILTAVCVFSIFYACDFIKKEKESKQRFVPVYIKPAKMISPYGSNARIVLPIAIGTILLLFIYFALTSTTSVSSSSKKVMLPGKSSVKNEKLPEFDDYFRWRWNVVIAPFKSLNKNYDSTDYMIYPSYKVEEGIVSENDSVIAYNDSFKQAMFNQIDEFDFYSIEKVIKSQGKDFTCGYVSNSTYKVSLFSIIMMFVSFSMLLFIYLSVIIKKGGRK